MTQIVFKIFGFVSLALLPLSCGPSDAQVTDHLSGDKQPLATELTATPTPEPKSGVLTNVCNTATPITVATAAPALQVITDKCASCHATQVPVFTTLQQAMPIRVSLQQSLDNGTMPPAGSPALTTAESQALTAWDNGTQAAQTLIDYGTDALLLDTGTVYYSTTIADALNTSCNSCHYPGGTSPDTTSYTAAKAQGSALLGAVSNGSMPPPNSIVPALDDAAKAALQAWVKEGEPLDASTPVATPTPTPSAVCQHIGS